MVKILHIITGLENGGAERQLRNLVRASDPLQIQHTVISLMDAGVHGVEIMQYGSELHLMHLPRGKVPIIGFLRLIKLIRTHKPDLLQTWLYHADLAGVLAAPLAGNPPVVWTLRCSDMKLDHYSLLTRMVIRSLRWLSRQPVAVISNSVAGMNAHQRLGYRPRQQFVIANGIDTVLFRPDTAVRAEVRATLGLTDDDILIGCIARRDPMKDHVSLLRAFAPLSLRARLLLAGKGTEANNPVLARDIADAGLPPNRVICLGERHDVPRLTAALDGFALASAFGEGFPNSVGEAMASGVSGVVTDVGDAAAIVEGIGEAVPPVNPPALTAALTRLVALTTEQRRTLGEKARRRIEERYTVVRMADTYSKLYAQLLSQSYGTPQTKPKSVNDRATTA